VTIVAPPAQGTWYNLGQVVTKVLNQLRLAGTDVDKTRIEQLVPVAAGLINGELDRVNPLTPVVAKDQPDTMVTPGILEALERLTIELYARGKVDTPGGTLLTSEATSAAIDVVREDISGAKSRWGIA
jgi:hypothetical protein